MDFKIDSFDWAKNNFVNIQMVEKLLEISVIIS